MAFFDRMKDSLTTAGQEVSQKAKNATENVRLSGLIKNNDKMIEKLLYQVGLKYYELHGQEEGTEYQELFTEIRRLKAENAGYQQELDNLTAVKKCPQCGFGNNAGAKFCISCGAPLGVAPMQNMVGKCCSKCGAMNDAEALFCVECGSKLEDQQVQAEEKEEGPLICVSKEPETSAEAGVEPNTDSSVEAAAEPEAVTEPEMAIEPEAATEPESAAEPEPAAEPEVAKCAKCGAPLEEDALFCTSCGARVE